MGLGVPSNAIESLTSLLLDHRHICHHRHCLGLWVNQIRAFIPCQANASHLETPLQRQRQRPTFDFLGTYMLQNGCLIWRNQKSSEPSHLDHLELSCFLFHTCDWVHPQAPELTSWRNGSCRHSRVIRLWPAAGQDRTFKVAPPVEQTICTAHLCKTIHPAASFQLSSKTTCHSKLNQKNREISTANIHRTKSRQPTKAVTGNWPRRHLEAAPAGSWLHPNQAPNI